MTIGQRKKDLEVNGTDLEVNGTDLEVNVGQTVSLDQYVNTGHQEVLENEMALPLVVSVLRG